MGWLSTVQCHVMLLTHDQTIGMCQHTLHGWHHRVISAVEHLLSFVHWLYTAAGAATVGCICLGAGTESPAQQLPWALHYTHQSVACFKSSPVSLSVSPCISSRLYTWRQVELLKGPKLVQLDLLRV